MLKCKSKILGGQLAVAYPDLGGLGFKETSVVFLATSSVQVDDMSIFSRQTLVHPRGVIKLRSRVDLYYC